SPHASDPHRLARPHVVTVCQSISSLSPPAPTAGPYPLSLHDALPILLVREPGLLERAFAIAPDYLEDYRGGEVIRCDRERPLERSEEHTSELQSLRHLVCRLLLEKKTNASQNRSEKPPPSIRPRRSSL